MIRIKKLRFANFGRFVGEHEINFADMPRIIQVDAKNHNTGGSSGSGKTTIFLALEYLLGINDTPATVLQSRLTEESLWAEGELESDDQIYVVTRHRENGLKIKKPDGSFISGSSKVSEDFLRHLIGIPHTLLRPMLHKRQREGGFFLSMPPTKMQAFLMECLGMKDYEEKIKKAEADASKLEVNLKVKEAEINTLKNVAANQWALVEKLKNEKITFTINDNIILDLQKKLELKKEEAAHLESSYAEKIAALVKPEVPQVSDDPEILKSIEECNLKIQNSSITLKKFEDEDRAYKTEKQKEVCALQKDLSVVKSQIVSLKAAFKNEASQQKEFDDIMTEISHAKNEHCPTCGQKIENGSTKSIVEKLAERAQKLYINIQQAKNAREELPLWEIKLNELERKIQNANMEIIQVNPQIEEIKKEERILRSKLEELNKNKDEHRKKQLETYSAAKSAYEVETCRLHNEYQTAINTLKSQISAYELAIVNAKHQMDSEKKAAEKLAKDIEDYTRNYEETQARISIMEKSAKEERTKFLIAKEAARFIKSYSNKLFQDSLAIVAENSTKI
ncbi:MAG TPA: hypothetical protein VNJ29_02215, partial [Candidatus Nitrosotenuis sp.]|nr:hypothetical protein [Candidatus Nitrosotenuis sp.]